MKEQTNAQATPAVDGAFLRALQEHQKGKVLTDLSEAMRKAVTACREQGKPSKVFLEVTFTPNGEVIGFSCDVDTKLPKPTAYAGVFFADDGGNLYRNDPNQEELPALTAVAGGAEGEQRKAVNQ